jgi:hypothetical protein
MERLIERTTILLLLAAAVAFSYYVAELLLRPLAPGLAMVVGTTAVIAAGLIKVVKESFDIHDRLSAATDRRLLAAEHSLNHYDEPTIRRATQYYIRPNCSNLDPGEHVELRFALVAVRGSLFQTIDTFLERNDPENKHVIILADSGVGKTSFLLNYYATNLRRHVRRRRDISLIYLGASDCDDRIKAIPNPREKVLFLDAFDEDVKARLDYRARFGALLVTCAEFRQVIITCRTQFFASDEDIPTETGLSRPGARPAGDTGAQGVRRLYLAPFDDDDVARYIRKRFRPWQQRQRRLARQTVTAIPYLSVRPMLLAHVPDIIESRTVIRDPFRLYGEMVSAWIRREERWVPPLDLRTFSALLAVDLYLNSEQRGGERATVDELQFMRKEWRVRLDGWQITGRSLLNRTAEGQYKFAHRSILEYFVIGEFLARRVDRGVLRLTDQMGRFISDIASAWLEIPTISLRDLFKKFDTVFALLEDKPIKAEALPLDADMLQVVHTFNDSGIWFKLRALASHAKSWDEIEPAVQTWVTSRVSSTATAKQLLASLDFMGLEIIKTGAVLSRTGIRLLAVTPRIAVLMIPKGFRLTRDYKPDLAISLEGTARRTGVVVPNTGPAIASRSSIPDNLA